MALPHERQSIWAGDYCKIVHLVDDFTTFLPPKAGSQRLGLDSGSSFHSARNDERERHSRPSVIPAKAGIHRALIWTPGSRFTPPGMTSNEALTHICHPALHLLSDQ